MSSLRPTLIEPRVGHRLWATTYDEDVNPLLGLESRTILPLLGELRGRSVVDVGCGTGRWTSFAHSSGARVLGVDLTAEMLAVAAAKPGLEGRLACADAQHLPLPDQAADLVLCSFCISYTANVSRALAELARVLRPGGWLVVSDVHPTAVASGWRRTFRSYGQIFEMQLDPLDGQALLDAGRQAGLTLSRTIEAQLGPPEREFFERAGKLDVYEAASQPPALHITLWTR